MENQVRDLEKRAGKVNSDAQYQFGLLYYIGIGVSQDFAKAFHWFKKAAGVPWGVIIVQDVGFIGEVQGLIAGFRQL